MKLWIAISALVLLAMAGVYQTSAQTPEPSTRPAASSPATSPATTQPDDRRVFKVKTVEEFVRAIGPDRIIQFEPGEYNLTGVEHRRLKYARWASRGGFILGEARDETLAGEFIIRGVKNLRIEGLGDKRVRVVVEAASTYVLGIERANDVELVNLEIGHLKKPADCGQASVVEIVGCDNITMRNCDLYGCGTEGLNVNRSSGFKFIKSIVRDCPDGIMIVDGCEDILLRDSKFLDNKGVFTFTNSNDIAIDNCRIENNKAQRPLFDTDACSNVTVNGGSIKGNAYTKLMDPENSVKTEKVDVASNKIVEEPRE